MSPSRYCPLHIAPLPSADSSGVSLLDDYNSSKPQTSISYSVRRKISIAVIILGILIFIASAGLASSLLVWLQSHRVQSHTSREDLYFLDAIVAVEGTRAPQRHDDGSLESDTTMYGLAISAVSAQVVALTVPFLLGLLGYRLASMWILAQEQERTGSMPTAAQYGLLVKLCGSANLFSAYKTVRYLKQGHEQRSKATSSLTFAFIVLVLAILLNHLLSAADLWLHTTASTFIHTSITEFNPESLPATGTKVNHTACPGPTALQPPGSNGSYLYYCNCACHDSEGVSGEEVSYYWGDGAMLNEGLDVTRNSSSTSMSVMVDDVAILVPSTMPDNVDNLTFNSFGLVAHCQPVVDCSITGTLQETLYCPSFNPPYNFSGDYSISLTAPDYSGIDRLNVTNNALLLDRYHLDSGLNPYGACVIFSWYQLDEETVFPADNSPGWYFLRESYHGYVSTCNMTAYNVSLSYSTLNPNNGFRVIDRVPSNLNTTSALIAALDPAYKGTFIEYLKSTLRTSLDLSTEAFSTVLSRNISYTIMGLASPLFECDVSTGGNYIVLKNASRYPLAPVSAVLAILYTYAFLALGITMSSVMLSSQEIIFTKNEKEHRVTAIELVQLRLTNALASITERFGDPARPELLLETSAVDMFYEHPNAERLGVVMKDYGGEDGEGMVRRTQSLRIESVQQRLTRLSGSTLADLETV